MKLKAVQELRTKEIEKLRKEAVEKELEFFKFNAEIKVSKEKNLKKGKNLRRDLSQILTIIREKELRKEGGEK
jgi:ribosomal protein L29